MGALTTNQYLPQQKFSLIFYGEQLAAITSPYDIWEHDRGNQAFGNKNAS
ncbi:MAG: hypothetical protein LBG59_08295 [Candidatus Peribacteria bacterium]|jgi:hypothetical protein|nr:hypothetical protein [Candidatus Peribacteria bacterium]